MLAVLKNYIEILQYVLFKEVKEVVGTFGNS